MSPEIRRSDIFTLFFIFFIITFSLSNLYYKKVNIKSTFLKNQKFEMASFDKFQDLAKETKYVVRSGELSVYSNIIIVIASGIEKYRKDMNSKVDKI